MFGLTILMAMEFVQSRSIVVTKLHIDEIFPLSLCSFPCIRHIPKMGCFKCKRIWKLHMMTEWMLLTDAFKSVMQNILHFELFLN